LAVAARQKSSNFESNRLTSAERIALDVEAVGRDLPRGRDAVAQAAGVESTLHAWLVRLGLAKQ
jgi:hypothetical protein